MITISKLIYKLEFLIISIFLVSVIMSCKKEPLPPFNIPFTIDTSYNTCGMYILNEGLYNMNNASLTYYRFSDSTATTDIFEQQNGRKLGDTGNHLKIYGDKVFIVVSMSSKVEVLNIKTGKCIKTIPFFNGSKARQPRQIAFWKTKAFVCTFDGFVAVIDTASLEIEKMIAVGRNPDGLSVTNNKLYVSNSGGLDFPQYDNTISVIDCNSLTEIKKITVQKNPTFSATDAYGDVYVVSRGNYSDLKMRLQIIDSKTDELKKTFTEFEALNLTIVGDTAYVYFYDFSSSSGSSILLLDTKTETIIRNNFISDNSSIETVYGIAVHPKTRDVFISDAHSFTKTGDVVCYSPEGKKKYSFKAGLNPSYIDFVTTAKVDTLKK